MTKSKTNRSEAALANDLAPLDQRLGPIDYRPIDELPSYANNPRKHPEKQLVQLAASIAQFGFVMPILVDESGTIIAGEARVIAARRLGMETVPVIVAQYWSPAQVRAYRLADNRLAEQAYWDRKALAIELAAIIEIEEVPVEVLGWDTAEIDLMLDEDEASDASASDPADVQFDPSEVAITREGDLWLLGKHRLLCGSSLDAECWLRVMGGDQAVMAFTDPPYNVPITGHVCGLGKTSHAEFAMASGEMSKPEFTGFLTRFISAMMVQVRDGGVIDVCMDWRHVGELIAAIEANGLSLINMCVWNKTNGGMGSLYRSKHELILIVKKGNASHTNNVELGKHGRYRTNVWDYAGVNTFGKTRMADISSHPTVKPVALVADAIRDVSKPDEIVLDAFMGSGTTILAAERTKRRCFGIEIAPGYVDVAIRRWEAMTGLKAALDGVGQTFAEVARERCSQESSEAAVPHGMVCNKPIDR